jgi:hypothetical protein
MRRQRRASRSSNFKNNCLQTQYVCISMVSPGGDIDVGKKEANHLPKTVIETLFEKVQHAIPEMFKNDVRLKERELRAAERRLQRRFIAEYRAQVSLLEPVLHERGVAVGTAIRDALLGDRNVDATYSDAIYKTPGLQLVDSKVSNQTRETLKLLDPLIEPVLTSFVSGVEQPINDSLNDIKTRLGMAWVASGLFSFGLGVVAGRAMSRK